MLQKLSNEKPNGKPEKHSSLHNWIKNNRYFFCWITFNKIDWAGSGRLYISVRIFLLHNKKIEADFSILQLKVEGWRWYVCGFRINAVACKLQIVKNQGKQIAYENYSCVNWINYNFHSSFCFHINWNTITDAPALLCQDYIIMYLRHSKKESKITFHLNMQYAHTLYIIHRCSDKWNTKSTFSIKAHRPHSIIWPKLNWF